MDMLFFLRYARDIGKILAENRSATSENPVVVDHNPRYQIEYIKLLMTL